MPGTSLCKRSRSARSLVLVSEFGFFKGLLRDALEKVLQSQNTSIKYGDARGSLKTKAKIVVHKVSTECPSAFQYFQMCVYIHIYIYSAKVSRASQRQGTNGPKPFWLPHKVQHLLLPQSLALSMLPLCPYAFMMLVYAWPSLAYHPG